MFSRSQRAPDLSRSLEELWVGSPGHGGMVVGRSGSQGARPAGSLPTAVGSWDYSAVPVPGLTCCQPRDGAHRWVFCWSRSELCLTKDSQAAPITLLEGKSQVLAFGHLVGFSSESKLCLRCDLFFFFFFNVETSIN